MRCAYLIELAAVASAGYVSIPFSQQSFSSSAALQRRASGDISLTALNNITGGGYYSDFSVGTPPQTVSFLLDTGSSDTWVNSVDADLCSSTTNQMRLGYCQKQFDQDKSSSFNRLGRNQFDITYLDGRNILGDYFTDTVHIGDISIKNQQLGLAFDTVRPTGIMGLGLSANVASEKKYKTIIDNMVDQGFIDVAAFSLYLNDLQTDKGNILFGAIDQQKFIGSLAKLPLVSESFSNKTNITSYNVRLAGFDLVSPKDKETVKLPDLDSFAILDSGSTISLLPEKQVQEIWSEFGVVAFQEVFTPFVDCAYGGKKGEGYIFEFKFDGKTIQVPMQEMVINAYEDIQDVFTQDPTISKLFSGWESACMFGIGSTLDFGFDTDQFTLLGATFLRSAYVVYDLQNSQLALAQANLNSTKEDIVEIKSGDLPEATGVKSQVTNTLPTSTTTAGSSSTSTTSPTSTGQGDKDNAAGSMAPAHLLGTVLAVLLGLMFVAL